MRLALERDPGRPLSVLFLGAHSDDIEIGCGATAMRLALRGDALRVRWVVFSAAGEREAEARDAAAKFLHGVEDVTVEVHDHRESYFPAEWGGIKDRFEDLKRGFEPDLVFCPWREDAHQDHRVLGELTLQTWRRHVVMQYEVPKSDGDLGHPTVYVPVSAELGEAKVKLLMECFGTQRQRAWFTPETFYGLMRLRGIEAQASEPWAEAFHARRLLLDC